MEKIFQTEHFMTWVLTHVPNLIRALLIPFAALVVIWILKGLIRRVERLADDDDPNTLSEREKRARTLGQILRHVVTVTVWGLALIEIFSELGVDIKPLLAGAGIIGLAIGFGAQALVKDLITGFFLLMENQIRVNDVVTLANVTGLVERINLRTTALRDVEGKVHIIPNGTIGVVTNHTREWSRAVLDVPVAYKEDTDKVQEVLQTVGDEFAQEEAWAGKLLGPFEYPGVERWGESEVVMRMMVQTKPLEQWGVQRELRRRVKQAFDARGIQIPFPQRTVHLSLERPGELELLSKHR